MQLRNIPFGTTDWHSIKPTTKAGEKGQVHSRVSQFGDVRVRMVEYSPGYVANHWCSKGHILLCMDGELSTELKDGRVITLTPGMSYQLADDTQPHRSSSPKGAMLFIVD